MEWIILGPSNSIDLKLKHFCWPVRWLRNWKEEGLGVGFNIYSVDVWKSIIVFVVVDTIFFWGGGGGGGTFRKNELYFASSEQFIQ